VSVVAGAAVAVVAGFVKGTIGFGFPTLATPLLALFIDVKTAVAVLVPPNLVLDGLQARRGGRGFAQTIRRLTPLLVSGAIGTVIGTRLLVLLPSHVVTAALGGFLVAFVVLNLVGVRPRVAPGAEPWLAPPVGLLAGIIGGITNVPGTPLVIYFYALELPKPEFVRCVAVSFIAYKLVQLAALVWYAAFPLSLLPAALGITLAALGSFFVGLRVQDLLDQKAFNRAVLAFLGLLGAWLTLRALT
jgi:uncharacterized membrane protein YfcA